MPGDRLAPNEGSDPSRLIIRQFFTLGGARLEGRTLGRYRLQSVDGFGRLRGRLRIVAASPPRVEVSLGYVAAYPKGRSWTEGRIPSDALEARRGY